jgi:hypothetical protein
MLLFVDLNWNVVTDGEDNWELMGNNCMSGGLLFGSWN